MRRPVLLIFTKNTCNIFFSKFHILIWVMVRVVMRFPSSALYSQKKITLIHYNHLWYWRVPANSTFCTYEFLAMRQCPLTQYP